MIICWKLHDCNFVSGMSYRYRLPMQPVRIFDFVEQTRVTLIVHHWHWCLTNLFVLSRFSHRAPDYFAESIQSIVGFWGWKCQSYLYYLLGMCKPVKEDQIIAGEDSRPSSKGIYFISTNDASPFALGRITDLIQTKSINTISFNAVRNVDPFLKEIDDFGKLQGNFNNLPYPKSYDNEDNYFTNSGSDEMTHIYVDRLRYKHSKPFDKTSMKYKVRKSSKLMKDYL